MKNRDRLKRDHPTRNSVNPEHLAFAFELAYGVKTSRLASIDPADKTISIEMKPGKVSELAFADIPFNRIMLRLLEELEPFYPRNEPTSFLKTTAILFRLMALPAVLRNGQPRLIEKDDAGDFFLGSKAALALATAPLSRSRAEYKKKRFTSHYRDIAVPAQYANLRISLPPELVLEVPQII